jgi:aspartate aminotransferase-like enzyme
MLTYEIPLVPGPTSVPQPVREAYFCDFGSGDLEEECFALYAALEGKLQQILKTGNMIAVMTGEGMLALWAALKSCLRPADRVLAVATGPFGHGIGEMARGLGARVKVVGFGEDEAADPEAVSRAIATYRPRMVTAVHCETPAGTLNPVAEIGAAARRYGVELFYVDAVASAAGAPLEVDAWGIDLALVGSQKCLSSVADLAIVAISQAAWAAIDSLGYAGYDALKPWRRVLEEKYFPYTPSWHALTALDRACGLVLDEGLEAALQRHEESARLCRRRARELGLQLFPREERFCSPTVTALRVPEGLPWPELDRRLRAKGMAVGGSWEKLAGKVFRVGHMGNQARAELVTRGMDVLAEALKNP